jgi:RNA polymerase sigma-70 factor, ECF subfamily
MHLSLYGSQCSSSDRAQACTASPVRPTALVTRAAANEDEAALLAAAKRGDNAAFAELVSRYDRRMFRIAQYIVQNREDAEDVVQDSFLKAFGNLAGFREESRFYTWLVRIVVNDALMKLRRRRRHTIFLDDHDDSDERSVPFEIADVTPDPEQALHHAQLRHHLGRAVKQLKPSFRAVFVLRDIQGLSIFETAEALSISVPLVKTRLLRARLKLRQRLGAFFGETFVVPKAGFSSGKAFRIAAR